MKRKLSLVIVAVFLIAACFTVLSACAKMDAYFLETMRDDLRDKTEICGQTKAQTYVTNASFTLPSSVKCLDENDKEYAANVSWTVVGGSGKVTMGEKTADGYVVTVPAQGDSDVTYVLVATLTDAKNKPYADANGNPYTVEFSCKVAAKGTGGNSGNQGGNTGGNQGGNTGTTKTPLEQIKEASVSAPTAGTNYLMVMYQGGKSATLYATGEQKNGTTETFLITTADKASAGVVTVESANGGFYLKITKSGASAQYLALYNNTNKGKVNVQLVSDSASATVWTTNSANILIGDLSGSKYSLGTYSDYDTIGAVDDTKYSAKYDTEEYVCRLIPADTTLGGGTGSGNTGNTGGDSGNQGNQGSGGSTTTNPDNSQTASIVFANLGWTDQTVYTSCVSGDITLSTESKKDSGKYYTNGGAWRLYSSEQAKLTISVASGYQLVSVKISFTGKPQDDAAGKFTYNSQDVLTDSVVTLSGTTAELVVASKQARITAIEITYKAA